MCRGEEQGRKKKATGKKLDQAYEYLNWWIDGWAGAFVAPQGYYMSTPANTKKHLPADEWDFWYEGKPAAKELPDPFGTPPETEECCEAVGGWWDEATGQCAVAVPGPFVPPAMSA